MRIAQAPNPFNSCRDQSGKPLFEGETALTGPTSRHTPTYAICPCLLRDIRFTNTQGLAMQWLGHCGCIADVAVRAPAYDESGYEDHRDDEHGTDDNAYPCQDRAQPIGSVAARHRGRGGSGFGCFGHALDHATAGPLEEWVR